MNLNLFGRRRPLRAKRLDSKSARRHRRVLFEGLEDRRLLAGGWHNIESPTDVNSDGTTAASDVLMIINKITRDGIGELPELAPGESPSAYYDISGDGIIAPNDALLVINELNAASYPLLLQEIRALSEHYMLVQLDRPAREELFDPDIYVVTGPDSKRLRVLEVHSGDRPDTLILATGPQQPVDYTVRSESPRLRAEGEGQTVVGSSTAEPSLETAIATSNTTVLLTFSTAMDATTAQNRSYYRITADNGENPARDIGNVTIESAVLEGDGRTVRLTTSSMDNLEYTVKVTNVKKAPATEDARINPTRNTTSFFGIADPQSVRIEQAVSTSESTIVLTFDQPLADISVVPANFQVAFARNDPAVDTIRKIGDPALNAGFSTNVVFDPSQEALVTHTISDLSEIGFVGLSPNNTDESSGSIAHAVYNQESNLFVYEEGVRKHVAAGALSVGDTLGVMRTTSGEVNYLHNGATFYTSTVVQNGPLVVDATLFNLTEQIEISVDGFPVHDWEYTDLVGVEISRATTDLLPVMSAKLSDDGTQVTLRTATQVADARYAVSVGSVEDRAGNAVDPSGDTALFTSEVVRMPSGEQLPQVVGAVSTGNTRVLVSFSESMGDSALQPEHYVIVQQSVNPEAGYLQVTDAEFFGSRATVALTTRSQNELSYQLTAVNVRDLAGNPLASPVKSQGVLLDPTTAAFPGTPPSGFELIDSDGDGLSDNAEQNGWFVRRELPDGSVVLRGVTSDPDVADTDGDGLPDNTEARLATDPRDGDTDDDTLGDMLEAFTIFSSPTSKDSDGDGLSDASEHNFFHTSPLLADTDGDQFSDGDEVITDNRNPRLADLPRVEIETGNVDLRLDVRFEEQTSNGTRTIDAKTLRSSLAQTQKDASTRGSSSTQEYSWSVGASACLGGACSQGGGTVPGGTFKADGGGGGSSTSTFSNESSTAAQRELATSRTTDKQVSAESVVKRVLAGASMGVEVNIVNAGNIAFTISNLEVTALVQDPRDPTEFVPVATLFGENNSPISIGPITAQRGPFRFSATEAFPSLVESLMENPRGMLFRAANFEIVDEAGRKFAFVEQDINDRTAFLEIDFAGEEPLEKHRVATNSTFDEQGNPIGIAMSEVLEEILGLEYVPEAEDVALTARPLTPEKADRIARSYSTRTVNGVETLHRVRGVSSELTGQDRLWRVLTPQGNITPIPAVQAPGSDFRSTRVLADQDFSFSFIKDDDGDGLSAKQEAFYRSIDSDADLDEDGIPDSRDTDNDGIDDGTEIYGFFEGGRAQGWTIRLQDGRDAYKTTSNPGRADTDLDGLTDCQELGRCDITVWRDADGLPTLEATTRLANGDEQPHTEISTFRLGVEPGNLFVLDDSDPEFTAAFGEPFTPADTAGREGGHHFSSRPAFQSGMRWQFEDVPNGTYAVSVTWPAAAELTDRATYSVLGARGGSASHRLSQQIAPDDFEDRGGTNWETLGYYEVVDGTLAVVIWSAGEDTVVRADAVRLDELSLRPTDPSKADTDGDGLSDAAEIVGFQYENLRGEQTVVDRFSTRDDASGVHYATNPLHGDTDNDGLDDVKETKLGSNPVRSDGDSVLDDDGDGLVNLREELGWQVSWRDRAYFEIIDDGEPGFGQFPNVPLFSTAGNGGRGGDHLSSEAARFAQAVKWDFTEVPEGLYRVSVTWPADSSLSERAQYSVEPAGASRTEHFVSQKASPGDFSLSGSDWEILGDFEVRGGALRVIAWSVGEGEKVRADAVLLRAISIRQTASVDQVNAKNADSDGDGLTDWEEFTGCRDRDADQECDTEERFGPTNPKKSDTDGDGLSDRAEVDGSAFPADDDDPTRKTDPVNWDTDGDNRGDGSEINSPWTVAVAGKPRIEVYSDPLKADADGDGLDDWRERIVGTHPNNADSDGDEALDGLEAQRGRVTSPLVADHQVTVTYRSVQVGKDSSDGADDGDATGAGDISFRLAVRYPIPNSDRYELENLATTQSIIRANNLPSCLIGNTGIPDLNRSFCSWTVGGFDVIQLAAPQRLNFVASKKFAVPFTEMFVLEGRVSEHDPGGTDGSGLDFGGFGSPDGAFAGRDLEKGSFSTAFSRLTTGADNKRIQFDVTVQYKVE